IAIILWRSLPNGSPSGTSECEFLTRSSIYAASPTGRGLHPQHVRRRNGVDTSSPFNYHFGLIDYDLDLGYNRARKWRENRGSKSSRRPVAPSLLSLRFYWQVAAQESPGLNAPRINRSHDTYERKAALWITAEVRDTCRSYAFLAPTICRLSVKPEVEIEGRREFTKDSALRVSPYSETALFTSLPYLRI